MSWFVEISEKAENILNSIDKNAAIALSKQKNTKTSKYNESFNTTEPENTSLTSFEECAPVPKQTNDVYLSFNDEPPSKTIEHSEQSISYQRSVSPVIIEKSNDQFQTEILQNEIHSLNNEISLLLNRAKIAEQKSISLSEKLASVERRNILLEEQLSKLAVTGTSECSRSTQSISSDDSSQTECAKNKDKSEWHEHYENQIQELIQEKTSLEETVKSKNDEIMMLKSRLNQQTFSFPNEDLNSRLRALTITLVQKQSSLERLTSEKSSLEAKYDQLQRKYEEVVNRLHQRISINDTDDVKAQIPIFKNDKIHATGLRHRLRNVYSTFNPISNAELLFKKSSLARGCVWIYMILMHCLVFLLLSSHMPETASV